MKQIAKGGPFSEILMVCFIQKSLTARSLFIHPAFTASISAWVGGANKIFLYIPTKTSSLQQ
jgi:hypothetical protein